MLSGKARDAFDLAKEPDKVRERYGRTTFGQGMLLSRRLIEAGTRFVQMNWPAVANGDRAQPTPAASSIGRATLCHGTIPVNVIFSSAN